ncbi:MAG TPA: hypothetical protein EYP90_05205 [Chromatiaceae bacterium]|nr:hypothetical protein [Chromatiaceae bacterium]HIP72653.1 hypothetical protein [Anaerolineae bacterium]
MITVVVHINNEDPVECELEKLPDPTSRFLLVNNPRLRDGKDLHYLDEDVTSMMIPWHRVNFVQLLPSGEVEEVVSFVRD